MEKLAKNYAVPSNGQTVAASIDWRTQGMVSEVVNQYSCGSDWAFAAIGAIAGACGVQQGSFTKLSTQQLLDCSGMSTGCSGGTMSAGFEYLKKDQAMTDADYPYNA